MASAVGPLKFLPHYSLVSEVSSRECQIDHRCYWLCTVVIVNFQFAALEQGGSEGGEVGGRDPVERLFPSRRWFSGQCDFLLAAVTFEKRPPSRGRALDIR